MRPSRDHLPTSIQEQPPIATILQENLHSPKKSSNFAAKSCKDMQNNADILSLESTLSLFFDCITEQQSSAVQSPFLQAMTTIFNGQTSAGVVPFDLDDDSTAKVIAELKEHLRPYIPDVLNSLNMPLTYLLDELICNIQQHAQTDKGYAYLMYNKAAKTIEIMIARNKFFHMCNLSVLFKQVSTLITK